MAIVDIFTIFPFLFICIFILYVYYLFYFLLIYFYIIYLYINFILDIYTFVLCFFSFNMSLIVLSLKFNIYLIYVL